MGENRPEIYIKNEPELQAPGVHTCKPKLLGRLRLGRIKIEGQASEILQ
jgi:hypothetical protein